jgi:hypothetical protein
MFTPIRPEDLPAERAAVARRLRSGAPHLRELMRYGHRRPSGSRPDCATAHPHRSRPSSQRPSSRGSQPRPFSTQRPKQPGARLASAGAFQAGHAGPGLLPSENGLMAFGMPIGSGSDVTGSGGVREDIPSSQCCGGLSTTPARSATAPVPGSPTTPTGPELTTMPLKAALAWLMPTDASPTNATIRRGAVAERDRPRARSSRRDPSLGGVATEVLVRTVIETWLLVRDEGGPRLARLARAIRPSMVMPPFR